ncbi:MAG: hypothetical protein PHF86_01670 [Candidatus Nanoarchaeia archaeon]|nr:hypothetical protein [Candidatus Nanoarchaeia archaeon]
METNLIKILFKKEIKHWKRTRQIFKRFNNNLSKYTFGIIVICIGTIFHYIFALMSTLYNSLLFIISNRYFKENLQRMALTIEGI